VELPVYNLAGEEVGRTELDETVFGQPFNEPLVHQAIVRYLANQRVGTHDTLRRGEVAGGGKKPWKQKGTGRARQGSTRAPHWRGGGVVFGPHPRDYRLDMPVKMRRQAMRSILSQRVRENGLRLIEAFDLEQPRTKDVVALLDALRIEGRSLLVTPELNRNVYLSARNLPTTETTFADQLNVYDVVLHPVLMLPVEAIRRLEQRLALPAKS